MTLGEASVSQQEQEQPRSRTPAGEAPGEDADGAALAPLVAPEPATRRAQGLFEGWA